MLTGDEGDMGG